jgi:hypothetical protein
MHKVEVRDQLAQGGIVPTFTAGFERQVPTAALDPFENVRVY